MIFILSQGYITEPPSKSKAHSRDIKSAAGTTCQCWSSPPPPPYFLILAFSHSLKSRKSNFLILLSDSHHSCGTLSKIKPAEATLLCFPTSALPEGEREKRERWHKSEKRCKNLPYFSPFSASAKGGMLSQCFSMPFFFLFNVSAPTPPSSETP